MQHGREHRTAGCSGGSGVSKVGGISCKGSCGMLSVSYRRIDSGMRLVSIWNSGVSISLVKSRGICMQA